MAIFKNRFLFALGTVATVAIGCGDPVSSTPPRTDSGTQTPDSGTQTPDSGTQTPDSGTQTPDSGTQTPDATATDASTPDATATDASTPDATATDASTPDATPPGDGGPYDPCMHVIDLDTAGMRTGTTTLYTGNNRAASNANVLPSECGGPTGHQVVLRYTPRASTRLHISTDNPGTDDTLDTVVFAQTGSMCGPRTDASTSVSLGCNDDSGGTSVDGGTIRDYTSVFNTTAVTMGQPIYIVVSAWLSSTTRLPLTGHLAQGQFTLSVTELPVVAAGGACDSTGAMNVCAAGTTCITSGATSTCIADGAANGRCNATGTACNAGLTCDGTQTLSSSRCRTTIAAGGTCSTSSTTMGVCAMGTHCITSGSTTTCIADGTAHGRCNATGTACNTGLACTGSQTSSLSRCAPVVAMGAACDPMGVMNVCATGTSCTTSGSTSTCQNLPYTFSNIASPAFVDACAMGMRLSTTDDDDGHTMAAVTIPWMFPFYGTSYTALWPVTNGYAQFGSTAPGDEFSISGLGREGPVVAPFFDDLGVPSTSMGICAATLGTAPNRRVIIEWEHARPLGLTGANLTFELVLNENGNTIDFLYQHLDPTTGDDAEDTNGSNAFIGVQGNHGASPVRHPGTVTTTTGLRLTPR